MRRSSGQQVLTLHLGTSLYIYQERKAYPKHIVEINGIRVMELNEALVRIPERFFQTHTADAVIALRMLRDPTMLLEVLLENGHSVIAGRLEGAFRHIGDHITADRIHSSMRNAGYDVREINPFITPLSGTFSLSRPSSPYIPRLQGMWADMRADVDKLFPSPPGIALNSGVYLTRLDEKYVQDAYHSLSIEGYQVTPELIEKIRLGLWDPKNNPHDQATIDTMAARGYFEAFQLVKASVREIIQAADAICVVRRAHHEWHQALFSPTVQAGLTSPSILAGYRRSSVFIRGSRHVPLPDHALSDAMDTFFELLSHETHPAVRAVLGHFMFVFIHPYSDGNGRMGRFLMNTMLASGGYPWTIIHLENRTEYLETLEEASVNRNIQPFAAYVLSEMNIA